MSAQHDGHLSNGKDAESGASPLQGGADLNRAVSITLTPSQFEEMYFQPGMKSRAQAESIKKFGNPTAIGIVGFLLSYAPTMACLMGWRGTSPASLLALLGAYYMIGGIMLWIGALGEFILGNTFPSVVFASFGSFWLSLGITLDPVLNVQGHLGMTGPAFNNAWGFYLIFWSIYVYFLTIASIKTNVTLFVILFTVAVVLNLLGVGYWRTGSGASNAGDVFLAAGAVGFVTVIAGYWILLHLCLAAVEFPVNVPLGDTSRLFSKKQTA